METNYGKLILLSDGGPEQEFELAKGRISVGRANTNDIVLSDARISRLHVRLECSPGTCTLLDQGSSNGTYVNGQRVQRADLKPGDAIDLGGCRMRFELDQPFEEGGMTVIDQEADLQQAMDHEVLPMTIHETSTPRLVVVNAERTWEIPLEDVDVFSIGRSDANQLVLEHPKVSRSHAEITYKGGIFILRDLDSTNGTWFNAERVDQLVLQDGDVFHIGAAQIIFKSGFQEESLTLADSSQPKNTARRSVVFVPGMMGSEFWLGSQRIFPDIKLLFSNPEMLSYPSDLPIEARRILDEVVIVPNLVKLDQYNRLGDYLVEELGYRRGVDYFEFAYDWRQDVRMSARQLAAFVETLPREQPVVIIAHSLGTMVSRYYVERLGGKQRIERIILMGGPHNGVVKALTSLLFAPEVLPFGIMGERLRQVSMTFPSSYQILPTYPLRIDGSAKEINFLEDESWLPEKFRPLLRIGREFRRELGTRCSIPAVSIFGYNLKTVSGLTILGDLLGKITHVDYKIEQAGDDTILQRSSMLVGTEIHPVQQHHGSLFVDNDVKMRLKVELTRPIS